MPTLGGGDGCRQSTKFSDNPMKLTKTGLTPGFAIDLHIVYSKFPDGEKFSLIVSRFKRLPFGCCHCARREFSVSPYLSQFVPSPSQGRATRSGWRSVRSDENEVDSSRYRHIRYLRKKTGYVLNNYSHMYVYSANRRLIGFFGASMRTVNKPICSVVCHSLRLF